VTLVVAQALLEYCLPVDVSTKADESDNCFVDPHRLRASVCVGFDSDESVGVFEMKMAA
jgi:hypothetical protein